MWWQFESSNEILDILCIIWTDARAHEVKMGKVTAQTKRNILELLQKGFTQREVSFKLNVPKTTVGRHSKKANIKPTTKKGRHKILSERDETFCVNQISTGKISSAVKLSGEFKSRFGIEVSDRTIRRVLKKKGLKSVEKKRNLCFQKKILKIGLILQNPINIGHLMTGKESHIQMKQKLIDSTLMEEVGAGVGIQIR
jgi:transposase